MHLDVITRLIRERFLEKCLEKQTYPRYISCNET